MSRVVTPQMTPPAAPPVAITQERIAKRAYDRWVKHGCSHGQDTEDWLQAEAELRVEVLRGAATTTRR